MLDPGPVVLFAGGLAGDGVARNTVHLANALVRRGAAVEVVCLEPGPLAAELRGVPVTTLGRAPGPRSLALARAVPALHRRLASLAPSVVVSMGNHAHLPVWAALRGLTDTPRLYRISNDPAHRGHAPAVQGVRELGLRLIASDATRVVCVSQAIAARDPFRRARRDRRLDVLPNGVCAAEIEARAAASVDHPWLHDRRPFLVAVGRVHPQKNYARLIEAFALARATGRRDLRLLILGAAPNRRRRALEAQAGALGVAGALRFEGEVGNPFPFVRAAAAYVLPSLWEGASNSLLEALACGTPVVASRDAGNASDVLAGGRYGVLADPTDPVDLACAILGQASPDTCVRPADRARDFALEAVTERLCAIVVGARAAHDRNQMSAEGSGHRGSPISSAKGDNNGVLT